MSNILNTKIEIHKLPEQYRNRFKLLVILDFVNERYGYEVIYAYLEKIMGVGSSVLNKGPFRDEKIGATFYRIYHPDFELVPLGSYPAIELVLPNSEDQNRTA